MATYSNIYIDQGSTYSSVIDVKDGNGLPFNLTGYSSRGQIRKSYSSSTAINFATSINSPTQGKVGISLTAGQTSVMKPGRYIYDVEIYNSGGHVVRISEGQVELNPGITDNNGGIILPPVQTLAEIIDEKIDSRTIVLDKLLSLSETEETNFYTNSKLTEKLVLKAPLASPTFTGTPFAPNPGLASNDTQIATTKFVNDKIDIFVDSTRTLISGKTLYVDAVTGTDTRTGLNKYDLFKPFATIGAAVEASVTGDTVYVRAGTYPIPAQINLNGKGHLYFEPGTTVSVATDIVAFSYSQNSIPIYIKGHADFVLAGSAGVLTMPSGNAATAVAFECNSIYSLTTVTGTIFNCAIGALSVDAKVIQLTPASVNATVFNITGSGKVTTRILFVYCGVFVNGVGSENPGGATSAQINADIWTLITYNTTAGMSLNRVTTQFRIVNYSHAGVGAALSWTEDTTVESHVFQGINWTSVGFQPHITFASTAGTTTNKIVRLLQSNRMAGASTNSLSSNVAINVGTHSTFAAAPATSNITFKVGSFTVDSDVNNY